MTSKICKSDDLVVFLSSSTTQTTGITTIMAKLTETITGKKKHTGFMDVIFKKHSVLPNVGV
jgi:hypothetical protein